MKTRVGLVAFVASIGAIALGVMGAAFDSTPIAIPTETANTTTADSSVGFPFMAWRVPDHPALLADGVLHSPERWDFVRVYIGTYQPDQCIIVLRSTALNQEKCYREHNYATADGWATLPIPKDETIQVSIDGTILIPKMRVMDLREVAYGH